MSGLHSSSTASPPSRLLFKSSACKIVLPLVTGSAVCCPTEVSLTPFLGLSSSPLGRGQRGLAHLLWALVKPLFASKAGRLVLLDVGVCWNNIHSTLYCIISQKLLKKRLVASEVWVVCSGNPVVNKSKRSSQMGFHRINAKQTPVTVTLLA